MSRLPILTHTDFIILERLRKDNPVSFFKNVTSFLVREMYNYIEDHRLWRLSIMGETRSGKSEVGLTLCLLYLKKFNECLKLGLFDDLDIWGKFFKKQYIKFTVDNIIGSQSDYINLLRDNQKVNKLRFGQIWQIDESREKIGGLGSFSEELDLQNLNNIVAKFMQSEIWITPAKFERRNTPYGLYVYKKDIINRINWCLLYKIQMTTKYTQSYTFMGWVKVPLMKDENLRKKYNMKKNEWIQREISGGGDRRAEERKKIANLLTKDKLFGLSDSGKSFILNKEQQITLLEEYITTGKSQSWNELEKYRIIEEARMIALRKNYEKEKIGEGA